MNPGALNILVRGWRLTALAIAALLLQHAPRPALHHADSISLAAAQEFFPSAVKLSVANGDTLLASDADDQPLGRLVTTSPQADHITGYAGPNNLLVALDNTGRIAGVKILESADTPSHVKALRDHPAFIPSLRGWNPALEPPPSVEGMGGSTLTGLAMLEGIAQRSGGAATSLRFPNPVSLEEIRSFFPGAASFLPDKPRKGWHSVSAPNGALAGYVVRTSPSCDGIKGYAGPTECLIAVDADQQTIRTVRIRKSYDSEDYVERISEDRDYLKFLTKWKVSEWPSLDFDAEKFEGVAGATLTSASIAESLRAHFKTDAFSPAPKNNALTLKDGSLWVLLVLATLQSFTKLRSYPWMRRLWQMALIAVLGLWLGQFLSLGLFAGWAQNGLPWKQALPLVALASIALLIPWSTRRQIYCHHICPHGAAQDWLGRFSKFHIPVPERLHRLLRLFPGLLLSLLFLAALSMPGLELNHLEPFDFWVLGTAAFVPACLALAGLAFSLFIPMAYCRYGCPTGALLSFVRTASNNERFGKKDIIAFLVLLCAISFQTLSPQVISKPQPTAVRGVAFGTTWSVKIKGPVSDLSALRASLNHEIQRIEKTLSHWSDTSATSRFNTSASTDPQEIPEELGRLVEFALKLHKASAGDYDITVAPLVAAWGYGPPGSVTKTPSDQEIVTLLATTGSQQLLLSADKKHLRKTHPALALDLGSILQGYAVDRFFSLLEDAGLRNFLIEIGGELRSKGTWSVAIENPSDARHPLKVISLQDAALATSGVARARRKIAGETVSHIISPKTGYPVDPTIQACSVQCATCLEADGWSTAIIASGLPKASHLAKKENLKVWLLDSAGSFKILDGNF